jgi:hypothetical protein
MTTIEQNKEGFYDDKQQLIAEEIVELSYQQGRYEDCANEILESTCMFKGEIWYQEIVGKCMRELNERAEIISEEVLKLEKKSEYFL